MTARTLTICLACFCRSIAELLDSCRHVLAASLPPDLQDVAAQLHAGDLDSLAVVISTERTARCARVEMLFLAQVSSYFPDE
jgi:hypothetical protein